MVKQLDMLVMFEFNLDIATSYDLFQSVVTQTKNAKVKKLG